MLGEDQPSWLCLDSDPFVTEQWIQMGAEHVIDESWCEVPCQIVSLFCKQVGGIWPNYNPQRWISSGSFHVESSARYAHRFCINIRSFARAIYCDVLFDLNSAGPSSWDWWSCNPVHLRRWITFLRSYGLQTRWLVSGRVWCIRFSSEFGQRIMPHCSMDCLKMSQEWEEKWLSSQNTNTLIWLFFYIGNQKHPAQEAAKSAVPSEAAHAVRNFSLFTWSDVNSGALKPLPVIDSER